VDEHNEGRILEKLDRMHVDIAKIEQHLARLNGHVGDLQARMCVQEDWREGIDRWRSKQETEDKDASKEVAGLKAEVAKMTALGGSFGVVISIVVVILRVTGVL
jgi:t-SNARE complex subunit (syntaxin)